MLNSRSHSAEQEDFLFKIKYSIILICIKFDHLAKSVPHITQLITCFHCFQGRTASLMPPNKFITASCHLSFHSHCTQQPSLSVFVLCTRRRKWLWLFCLWICHAPSVSDPVLMVFTDKFWALHWNTNVWQMAVCSQAGGRHGTAACGAVPAQNVSNDK